MSRLTISRNLLSRPTAYATVMDEFARGDRLAKYGKVESDGGVASRRVASRRVDNDSAAHSSVISCCIVESSLDILVRCFSTIARR